MKKTGFYIIKDKFFDDMSDPYLKENKARNRPHCYCFEDSSTGIYWIPLSTRTDKYRRIMEKKEKAENHLVLTSEHTAREIEQKARKVMYIGSSSDKNLLQKILFGR